ncbi:hypothetical protein ACSQ67_023257 [Phaseolus vulgaris]
MGKKRKHGESSELVARPKRKIAAPERPTRTLLGWKDKSLVNDEVDDEQRWYRHLMLNLVSLLPHCKKDNKVESKETKGATLNELVELKSCSSCLFFECLLLSFSMHQFQCGKQKDLYLRMAKCPGGPSVKFLVSAGNILIRSLS